MAAGDLLQRGLADREAQLQGAARFTVLQLTYKSLELIVRVALISSCPFRLQHSIKSSSLAPCPRQQIELCPCVYLCVCVCTLHWAHSLATVPHVRACLQLKTRRCELFAQRQPKMPKCQSDASRYPNSSWQQVSNDCSAIYVSAFCYMEIHM